jgi:WD40 repeat protein
MKTLFHPNCPKLLASFLPGLAMLLMVFAARAEEAIVITWEQTAHSNAVKVAYSPDGTMLATAQAWDSAEMGSENGSIKVWRASNGALLRTLALGTNRFNTVRFSPDGSRLAGAGRSQIAIWHCANWTLLQTNDVAPYSIGNLVFRPGGGELIVSSWMKTGNVPVPPYLPIYASKLECYTVATDGSLLLNWSDPFEDSWSFGTLVDCSPDGSLLAVTEPHTGGAGNPTKIRILTLPDGSLFSTLSIEGSVGHLFFGADNQSLWFDHNYSELITNATPFGFNFGGSTTYTTEVQQDNIDCYRVSDGTRIRRVATVGSLRGLAPDGQLLFASRTDGQSHDILETWLAADGLRLDEFSLDRQLTGFQVSPSGPFLAAGTAEGSVMVLGHAYGTNKPVIIGQPQSQTISTGDTAILEVAAITQSGVLEYQWQLNGNNMLGATNNRMVFANAQPDRSGLYQVLVKNNQGTTTSRT